MCIWEGEGVGLIWDRPDARSIIIPYYRGCRPDGPGSQVHININIYINI